MRPSATTSPLSRWSNGGGLTEGIKMISIEDLRSQESHADTNFVELQELRKIHQDLLMETHNLEKQLSEKDQIIISLSNELAKYTNAANSQQTSDAIQRSTYQDKCGEALRYDDCSIQDG